MQGDVRNSTALAKRLGGLLQEVDWRVAVAESCTGGLICDRLVADPVSGGVLERGLVVYSIDSKCELLGLARGPVEACEGVSSEVAEAMAASLLEDSGADLAIATTGFAGPQENDEEVGLVYIAIAAKNRPVRQIECHFGDVGREKVRELAAGAALQGAIDEMEARHSSLPAR